MILVVLIITQDECTGGMNGTNETSACFIYNNSWSIFCEWNIENNIVIV